MILVDTNILVRLCRRQDPLNPMAFNAIRKLRRQQDLMCIAPQNLCEFWVVATRPENVNGLGFSSERAFLWLHHFENLFSLLEEPPATFGLWKNLVRQHRTVGKPAYDARLAAVAHLAGIHRVLTFNTNDFARYGVTAIDPHNIT
jgi:predicted nucleic acid-binding protein